VDEIPTVFSSHFLAVTCEVEFIHVVVLSFPFPSIQRRLYGENVTIDSIKDTYQACA
jgi:hypothetical protein